MSENERIAMAEAIASGLRMGIDMLSRAQDQLRGAASRTGWDYVHTQVAKAGNALIEVNMLFEQLMQQKPFKK